MKKHNINHDRLSDILKVVGELNVLNDLDAVLNQILLQTRILCKADAGSIFLLENNTLKFSYFQNNTLAKRDPNNDRLIYTKLEIEVNAHSIAGYCALNGATINLPDVYNITDNRFHFNQDYDKKLDYKTTSVLTVPLMTSLHKTIGVMQIINAMDNRGIPIPFTEEDEMLVSFFAVHAAGSVEKAILTREIILRMIRMAEMRDPKETGAHVNRVGAYSVEIYRQWAKNHQVPENEAKHFIDNFRIAAMLHDVGKVAISDLILKKPGKLDFEEFKTMQTHTTQGANLFIDKTSEMDCMASDIALYHHEKFDGNGYPNKLQGADIPLTARIVAIADVFDALICRRVYKEPWTEQDVLAEIENQSGKQFDTELVLIFFQIFDTIKAIRNKYPDEN